jgi:hypothetical protein
LLFLKVETWRNAGQAPVIWLGLKKENPVCGFSICFLAVSALG